MLDLEPSQAAVANALGYTSIGFWLFAQAPQVVKNARLRSCEGLALPFLANWLLGDITNLVGCVLTDQLPFQTYLAAYFCAVDFTLVGQYFYYRPNQPPQPIFRPSSQLYTSSSPQQSLLIHTAPVSHTHPQSAHSRARSSSSAPRLPLSAGSSSTVRAGSKRVSDSPIAHQGRNAPSANNSIYRGRDEGPSLNRNTARDGSYQAIYEAALEVARAAERAEHRRQYHSRSRTRRTGLTRKRQHRPSGHSDMPSVEEDALSPDLDDRSAMFDSFHSDMSALTDNSASSSTAGAGRQQQDAMTMSTPALLMGRGRSLQRTATGMVMTVPTPPGEEGDEISGLPGEGGRGLVEMRETRGRSKSRSVSLARGSGGRGSGRRAAAVAFMSLGLLAGWNGLGRAAKIRDKGSSGGMVLRSTQGVASARSRPLLHPLPLLSSSLAYDQPISPDPAVSYILLDHPIYGHPDPPADQPPDYKRIIGRISAWACTTLYLTSRLPQIWKNFERKSVEGLSILLFLFAFCGNVSYVASIVFNPAATSDPSDANQYLLEALP